MKEIERTGQLQLQILVSGAHLSAEFGMTAQVIESDGFSIDARVEMLLSGDSPAAITKSMGLGLIGMADALARLDPDLLIILGDRFEALAAAQAAVVARIPIAHIHGGEISEGAIDETIRHAITKLSTYHFACAEPYRKRIVQLGESPDRCWNFGAPGLDHLTRLQFMTRQQLEEDLGFSLADPVYLVTCHPATMADESPQRLFASIAGALLRENDARAVFTCPNADANGRILVRLINEFVEQHPKNAIFRDSLGQLRYLSLMRLAAAVVGNSSSGIVEAPAMRVPTVNVGRRQQGRLRSAGIVDVEPDSDRVYAALQLVKTSEFKRKIADSLPCYGMGDASRKIVEVICRLPLQKSQPKPFFDLPHQF